MSADDKTRILPQVTEAGVGTQLSGIYELDERIASGGMGEVYRGHNIQTDDLVAIKIVLTEFARDPTILSLFKKEASVLNHLAHDAIVRYHVFTVDPGIGRPYLAMEYVHGESLVDLMGKGPMSPEDAAKLCARLASGLSAAHEAGVIHRDLSPDNIILPGGRVDRAKIIDFGIARSAAVGGETLIGGKFAGKYNYVSPEQLGLFGGEVSEQSDIYSLGLVLAAALRAEPLDMSGSQVEIVEKRRTVPDLSDIDPGIRQVLAAMLQPDPARRPHGMAAVAEMANAARTTLTQPPEQRARESTVVGAPAETSTPPWSDPQPAAQTAPPSSPPAATGAGVATAPPERPADFVEHRRPAFLDSAPAARAAVSAAPPRRTGRIVAIAASLLVVAAGGAYLAGAFEPTSEPVPQQAADAEPTEPPQPTAPAPESPSAPAAEPPAEDTASATPAPAEATPPETAEATPPQPAEASPPVEPTPQPEIAETSPAPTESKPTAQASPPATQPAETAPAAIPTAPAPETTPPVATEAQPAPSAQPQAKPAEPAPAESADNGGQPPAEQQVSRAEPEPPAQPQAEQQPEPPTQAEPQAPAPTQPESVASEEQPPAETAAPAPQPVPQPEPTQPEPQVTAKLDNVAERISWLRSYTGGQCFYATTTSATDTATEIEGFGTTVEPFMQLLQSFQTRFNMEPDVGVRLIEPAQCVVADFLRDLPRSSTNPPELTLDRTTIPNGTPVSGRLAELEGRKTELILIDHKGMAFNLNSRLTMNGSRAAFSIPIGLSASDQAAKKVVPQVIIALTSPGGIRAAEFINPVPAKDLLPKVLDEIRTTGSDGTATAKYFRLGG